MIHGAAIVLLNNGPSIGLLNNDLTNALCISNLHRNPLSWEAIVVRIGGAHSMINHTTKPF